MEYHSNSPEETQEIGQKIGALAKPGDVFCLIGNLGVGKTVFTKGFAKALEIHEHITSPTFTIVNEYNDGKMPFYHFDVYRIEELYEMEEIGYEDYFYGEGVTFVEWANLIEELIPKQAKWIFIEKDLEKGLDYRKIRFQEVGDV